MASQLFYACIVLFLAQAFANMADFKFENCGSKIGCIKFNDATCTNKSNCRGIAMYYYNKTAMTFHFYLSTNQKWMAFGQKEGGGSQMIGIKGVYCSNPNAATVSFFGATATSNKPSITKASSAVKDVKVVSMTSNGGVTSCYYTRKMNIVDADSVMVQYNLTSSLPNAMAYGTDVGTDGAPNTIHAGAEFLGTADWMEFVMPAPHTDAAVVTGSSTLLLSFAFVLVAAVGLY